ncbi:MAG TPA: LysM domain-containing protein [Polyangia bacterium]|nr:LysM domain-containing protein [Polyangia bacterium]
MRLFGIILLLLCVFGARALAEPPAAPALREYRVEPGDTTCLQVAKKVFGDPKAVRLIHAYNRLGPQPHHLQPGQILRLPVSEKAPAPEGPDAHLSFVRNRVEAYTPEPHRGEKDEALLRGNRVSTEEASSAELTFRDDSRLQLGERTLVIVLGDESRKTAQRPTGETTLVEGELRAHLGALAGAPAAASAPFGVRTSGGHRIAMERGGGQGEAKIEVEPDRLARLAVYQGRSRLGSRGKEVVVPEGFGSQAKAGQRPTPPRPLPVTPVWVEAPKRLVLIREGGERAVVTGTYEPGSGEGPAIVSWHVQVARDLRFNDLVVDTRVPADTTRLEAQGLAGGTFYARVSGIDAERFEGKFSPPAEVRVAELRVVPATGPDTGKALARIETTAETPADLVCGVDEEPLTEMKAPRELAPGRAHRLRCAIAGAAEPGGATEAVSELEVSEAESGEVQLATRLGPVRYEAGGAGLREVTLTVRDAAGRPVAAQVMAEAEGGAGVSVTPVETVTEGEYRTTVRWSGAPSRVAVRFRLGGGVEKASEATFAPPPRLEPRRVVRKSTQVALEPGLFVNGALPFGTVLGRGGGGGGELGVRFPVGQGQIVVGVRAYYERSGCMGACPTAPDQLRVREHVVVLGLPVSFRFRPAEVRWVPYVTVQPQVAFARISLATDLPLPGLQRQNPGVTGVAGVGVRVGPGHFFLELGYRYLTPQDLGLIRRDISGGVGFFGYRFAL